MKMKSSNVLAAFVPLAWLCLNVEAANYCVGGSCPGDAKYCTEAAGGDLWCYCGKRRTPVILSSKDERWSCVPCVESDTSYHDNKNNNKSDLIVPPIKIQSENPEACRNLCYEYDGCKFWTLDVGNRLCHLIKSRRNENVVEEGFVSGVKVCEDWRAFKHPMQDGHFGHPSTYPGGQASSPLLNILHRDGGRSVLQALPATFGDEIKGNFQLDAFALRAAPFSACSRVRRVNNNNDDDNNNDEGPKLVAVVTRGGCKFVTKAKNIQDAGFAGVVILDTQSHTGFGRITGHDASVNIPAVFLLKPEADRLTGMLQDEGVLRMFIQDSSSFSRVRKNNSQTQQDQVERHSKTSNKVIFPPPPPSLTKFIFPNKKKMDDKMDEDSFSLVAAVVAGVAAFALAVVCGACAVYAYHVRSRRNQRRQERTRCQRAMRDMDREFKRQQQQQRLQQQFSDLQLKQDKEIPTVSKKLDVMQTAKVLECPVCLEISWPPKKIYQCLQGHIICEDCRSHPQLHSCPICRQSLKSDHKVCRNLALENLAVTLENHKGGQSPELTIRAQVEAIPETDVLTPSAPSFDDVIVVREPHMSTPPHRHLTVALPP